MRTLLPLLAFVLHTALHAQWSTDPDAPVVLCDAPEAQTGLSVIDDGEGGWYACWLDSRAGGEHTALYAQRVTQEGIQLWEPNGRAILVDSVLDVRSYSIKRFDDGDLAVIYITDASSSRDSVRVMRFDAEGAPVWAAPANVGGHANNTGAAYNAWRPRVLIGEDDGLFVSWMHAPQNSDGRMAFNRVTGDGTVLWAYNALVFNSAGFGYSDMVADGLGGVYAAWSVSNAMGSPVRIQRVTGAGTLAWETPISAFMEVTSDNSNEFRITTGADGTLLLVGGVTGYDLKVVRVFPDGTVERSDLCVAAEAQRRPSLSVQGDRLFVTWQDNRNGSPSTSYAQKLTLDGSQEWQACGMPGITMNNYIPHPRITGLPDGGAIITQQVTTTPQGMRAQRLDATGAPMWTEPARYTDDDLSAFYENHLLRPTTDNGAVAFWATAEEDLYMNRIAPDGTLGSSGTGVGTRGGAGHWTAFPVPTERFVQLEGMPHGAFPQVHAADGGLVSVPLERIAPGSWRADLASLPAGLYLVRTTEGVAVRRVLKQ